VWVVGLLVPQFVIGFLIALGLRRRFRFRGLYQAVVFYPWAISGFLIGVVFRWMVLFAFASRWIVAGLTQGATKG
jgi:multiple sugar transport system permease protein